MILDQHEIGIELLIRHQGVSLVLNKDTDAIEFNSLFNAVEHGLKLGNTEDIIGEKNDLYVLKKEMVAKGIADFVDGDIITGKISKYEDEKDWKVSVPKKDKQLPGILLFLNEVNNNSNNWANIPT